MPEPRRPGHPGPHIEHGGRRPAVPGRVAVRRTGLLVTLVLGGLTALPPLSMDMYLPALPEVTDALRSPAATVQLTLTACLAGMALGQLVVGPMSDKWGRRRPLLIGMVVYVLATAVCAFAPDVELLIAFRLLQGLAGAAGIVIARAVVRDLYDGRRDGPLLLHPDADLRRRPRGRPADRRTGAAPDRLARRLRRTDRDRCAPDRRRLEVAARDAAGRPAPLGRRRRGPAHHGRPAQGPGLHRLHARGRSRLRRPVRLHLGLAVRGAGDLRRLPADLLPAVRPELRRPGRRRPDQRQAPHRPGQPRQGARLRSRRHHPGGDRAAPHDLRRVRRRRASRRSRPVCSC